MSIPKLSTLCTPTAYESWQKLDQNNQKIGSVSLKFLERYKDCVTDDHDSNPLTAALRKEDEEFINLFLLRCPDLAIDHWRAEW